METGGWDGMGWDGIGGLQRNWKAPFSVLITAVSDSPCGLAQKKSKDVRHLSFTRTKHLIVPILFKLLLFPLLTFLFKDRGCCTS